MINLLPPDAKAQIRAARGNVILARYTGLFGVVLLFMIASFGVAFYITLHDKSQAEADKQTEEQASASYTQVKQRAETFAKNLSAAKSILKNQITYSSLLIEITNTLPRGTVLSGISLSSASFGKPLSLSGRASSYDTALQLKTALAASHLFGDVSITSITVSQGGDPLTTRYPYAVTLSATLTKDIPTADSGGPSQ